CRALEGIGIEPLTAVCGAPVRVQSVQSGCDIVGMTIANAKDDGLLLRTPVFDQILEEIFGHRLYAIWKEDSILKGCVQITRADFIGAYGLTSPRVYGVAGDD